MQNFVDYYSNFFARRLFRQERKQAAENPSTPEPAEKTAIPQQDRSTNLLDYAIFFNEGCGHQSAAETQEQDQDYLQRWLTFYKPDINALPQHHNIRHLQALQAELYQHHASLNSPLLAGAMLCLLIAAFLSMKNLWLLIVPVALFGLIWAKTYPALNSSKQEMQHNEQLLTEQQALLTNLKTQAKKLDKSESLRTLRANYTRRLEKFLQASIQEFLPDLTPLEISEKINAGEMQLYALESRGILQIPNIFQQHEEKVLALDTLIHKTGQGWCAVQPHEELRGLTRLHYFYGLIRLEQGAIICSAFYDWVGNQLYDEQRDYCSYQNMSHIRHFETAFPTENILADELPDEVYQLHFGEPVDVVSLSVRNGANYYCAVPVHQPTRKTTLSNLPDTLLCRHLRHDRNNMVTDLNRHIEHQHAPAVATNL